MCGIFGYFKNKEISVKERQNYLMSLLKHNIEDQNIPYLKMSGEILC